MILNEYKQNTPTENRVETSSRLFRKYSDKIAVIVQSNNKNIKLKKNKFLAPKDLMFSQFQYVIRKQINELKPEDALYYFNSYNGLISPNITMLDLYQQYKDKEDGYLYIFISVESTFG
jgi:hypothetical protein